MKDFNWEDFKNYKCAVHCQTEEEAKKFLSFAKRQGCEWSNFMRNVYDNSSKWYVYGTNTYYVYEEHLLYGNINENIHNLPVFEFSDIYNKLRYNLGYTHSCPKLKDGMVVETREGKLYLVRTNYNSEKILCNNESWEPVSNYNEELKIKDTMITDLKKLDIMKIYTPLFTNPCNNLDYTFHKDNLTCVWEREEVIEMTLAQVCKELGKNIKIIKED